MFTKIQKPLRTPVLSGFSLELVTWLEQATCSLRMSCTTYCATLATYYYNLNIIQPKRQFVKRRRTSRCDIVMTQLPYDTLFISRHICVNLQYILLKLAMEMQIMLCYNKSITKERGYYEGIYG